ncbi:uncharacterized protein BDR25DRAFT_222662, partial [Lindgomyces ingoldianus]
LYTTERFDRARESMIPVIERCRGLKVFVILLASISIDPTIICGYLTSECARATTLSAIQHRFSPHMMRESCGDGYGIVNDANLFNMNQKFA